jgi:hypothetical protein
MKELLLVIIGIMLVMIVVVWIGAIGATVAGTCDWGAPASTGDAYGQCGEKGFDLLYGLLGATPEPRR